MRILLLLVAVRLCSVSTPSIGGSFVAAPEVFPDSGVNLVTGEYVETHTDIATRGAEPLLVQRSHHSEDIPWRVRGVWRIQDSVIRSRIGVEGGGRSIKLYEADGTVIPLAPGGDWGFDRQQKNEWNCIAYPMSSYCNTGKGTLCGRNNLRNIRAHFSYSSFSFEVVTGSGEKRIYRHYGKRRDYSRCRKKKNKEAVTDEWRLYQVTKPNGNRIRYFRDEEGRLTCFAAIAEDGTILGEVGVRNSKGKNEYVASDGQIATYSFTDSISTKNHGNRRVASLLTSVELPSGSKQGYSFDRQWDKMTPFALICRQAGEFALHTKYWYDNIRDHRFGRVRHQWAPVGPQGVWLKVASYDYHFRSGDQGTELTKATVTDLQGMRLDCHVGPDERVWKTERWHGGHLLLSEGFGWSHDGLLLGKSVGDGSGKRYSRNFTYDRRGNVIEERLTGRLCGPEESSRSTTYTYSDDGLNLCLSERSGEREWHYTYRPGTDLVTTKVEIASGERESLSYDSCAVLVEKVVDDGVCLIERRKNCAGIVQSEERLYFDPLTGEEKSLGRREFCYDKCRRVVAEEIFDSDGVSRYTLHTDYDNHGHVVRRTDATGEEICFEYDERGNCTCERHFDHALHHAFDLVNRLVRTVREDLFSGERREIAHRYNSLGRRVASADELGRETLFTYDPIGQLTATQSPAIRLAPQRWERATHRRRIKNLGSQVVAIDPLGNEVTTDSTCENRPYHRLYPDGTSQTWEYSTQGHLIRHVSRPGFETHYKRDYAGRAVETEGHSHSWQRFEGSRLVESSDGGQRTYDRAGRLIRLEEEEVTYTYSYDSLGQMVEERVSSSDAPPLYTRFAYDLAGRIIEERQETDQEVVCRRTYRYDGAGRLLATALGDDPEEQFFYNGFGELIRHIAPDGGQTRFEYDHGMRFEGEPVLCKQVTDPNGTITTTYEDGSGRVVHLEQVDQFSREIRSVDLFYDLCGRRVCEIENEQERRWEYDWEGHITAHIDSNGSTTRYAYDASGQLIQLTKPSGAEVVPGPETAADLVQRTFDARGRLTRLTLPDGSSIDYEWDAARLRRISRGDYSHEFLEYNDRGQPTRESLPLGWGEVTRRYDPCGRPLEILHSKFHERVEELDPAGRPLSISFRDDRGDQLDITGELTPPSAEITRFDLDGRLIQRGPLHFSYDTLDRLTRVEGEDFAREYSYDNHGRRLSCGYYAHGQLKRTTTFVHDGSQEVGEMDATGRFLSLRIPGPTAAVAIELEGSVYVPLHDRRGCVRMLLDGMTVAESYRYTPYGSCEATSWWRTASTSHIGNPYRFGGKPTDDASGLICFGHRTYDPAHGRWLTPDPLGYAAGTDLTLFCDGDPLSHVDPTGLFAVEVGLTFGGPSNGMGGLPLHTSLNMTSAPSFAMPSFSGVEPGRIHRDPVHRFSDYRHLLERASPEEWPDLLNWTLYQQESSPHHAERVVIPGASSPGLGIFSTHGVWNDSSSARDNATYASNLSGGYEVTALHHRAGIPGDLSAALDTVFDFAVTRAVKEQVALWREYLADHPGAMILQLCHSYGAAVVRNALIACPDLRDRIVVIAVAPAAYIWRGLCREAVHLRTSNDWVPRLDRFGATLAENVIDLPLPPRLFDWRHPFQNPIYRGTIEQWISDFRHEYGAQPL